MLFMRLAAFALLSLVSAEPILSPHVVLEKRTFNPEARGWRLSRRMDSDAILPIKIGLAQRNLETIEDLLLSVSHPDSPDYGKHWSADRIVNHFAPSTETVEAVVDWLMQNGIDRSRQRLSTSKSWLQVNMTVAEVEELLKAEYHVYEDDDGAERVGCSQVSIALPTPHYPSCVFYSARPSHTSLMAAFIRIHVVSRPRTSHGAYRFD